MPPSIPLDVIIPVSHTTFECEGCENAKLVRDECEEWWYCTLPEGMSGCTRRKE